MMFSFLSCEGEALQSLLIKAQHGRAVNSTAVKARRKRKEKEKRKGKQRQRQSRDKDKDGEREREQERERERESDGRASEFVAHRMLSVGPAGSVNIHTDQGTWRQHCTSRNVLINGTRQRECAQKENATMIFCWARTGGAPAGLEPIRLPRPLGPSSTHAH